jgi:hypothetical protein
MQGLLKHFKGDEVKAMEWMLAKHPVTELLKVKGKSGHSPETVYDALPPEYDPDQVYGAYILGEKVGPFFLNLNGISTELTVDRWFMRTWNRLMGTLVGEDGAVQDVPRGKNERAAMLEAIGRLEKEFGLETSQVQAALWYYEQGLYSRLGQKGMFGGTYASAAKDVYELRSSGYGSRGEATASERENAATQGARGSAESPPRRVRGEDTESAGAGPERSRGLFEDLGELQSRQREPRSLGELKSEAANRDPRRTTETKGTAKSVEEAIALAREARKRLGVKGNLSESEERRESEEHVRKRHESLRQNFGFLGPVMLRKYMEEHPEEASDIREALGLKGGD